MARASSSSFHAGFTLSVTLGSSAGSWGSGLAASALFDAMLCCHHCAESGKGTFERAVWVARRYQYRFKNILVLCSGLIFGLGRNIAGIHGLRVAEGVGV